MESVIDICLQLELDIHTFQRCRLNVQKPGQCQNLLGSLFTDKSGHELLPQMYLCGLVVVSLSRGMRRATEVDGGTETEGRSGADAEPAASSEREPARPE